MDANDKKYFDDAFHLIQTRLTNLETQITLLFNAEKKRMAETFGKSFEQINEDLTLPTEQVFLDLEERAAALKASIESRE